MTSISAPSVELKELDTMQHEQFKSDTSIDDRQPEEAEEEEDEEEMKEKTQVLPKRRIFAKFRLLAFSESDDESDYVPSEEEDKSEEEDTNDEELFEEGTESEEQEEVYDDYRWWESIEDKRRWEKRYRLKDAAFRKKFGCGIDTSAHPETRRRVRKHKTRHRVYKYVVAGLVVAYLVQLAMVYSASEWAFSMVTWRPSITGNERVDDVSDTPADTGSSRHSDTAVKPHSPQHQIPEHVRTGLHLCSTLSRRVVKSEHDVTATQHALRACDIAVKFAPLKSREAVEAHVLRGDLRSLLSRFDGADEDYQVAMSLVMESESDDIVHPKLSQTLPQELELKVVSNRWTLLYKAKRFKDLRREAKTRARDVNGVDNDPVNAVKMLAEDWVSAFKKKKTVLDVLTLQRGYTLRRLKYEDEQTTSNEF
ncbi:hypothetical protein P3T76_005652 [Phytophthora citrophthora]|uniref:Uncharacterized protein n=1 Tax=Phytophthora citrophthora TaxID=4793 RepID=A0AAD9GQU6_9STRA|nr:hypothetical protein P3T76_005652 [Phytophthora citrophthora]